jgi:hypothetical protein
MEVKQELQIEESDYVLDIEDAEDLMTDCFYFILSVIEKEDTSPDMAAEGLKLMQRLSEGLSWETTH